MQAKIERYVALDVHNRYCMMGAVDSQQQIVMQPRKVSYSVKAKANNGCWTTSTQRG